MRTPRHKRRASETLERIANMAERRAHSDVVTAEQELAAHEERRLALQAQQEQAEQALFSDTGGVTSSVIQLISVSRLGRKLKLDAIDQDIAIAYARVGAKRKQHKSARHKKRTAELVREKMVTLHVAEHLGREQKDMDEVANQRFAARTGQSSTGNALSA